MSIPDGTKFHGVAPSVDTSNRGSAQLNAGRDAYTIEDVCTSCTESITLLSPVLFVLASSGGSKTLTEMVNIVDFDWVGGAGTYELILPNEITKAYNGCAVWSDGVEWIVIQAKAT